MVVVDLVARVGHEGLHLCLELVPGPQGVGIAFPIAILVVNDAVVRPQHVVKIQLVELVFPIQAEAVERMVIADARITSYNVCYTKLLRSLENRHIQPCIVDAGHGPNSEYATVELNIADYD